MQNVYCIRGFHSAINVDVVVDDVFFVPLIKNTNAIMNVCLKDIFPVQQTNSVWQIVTLRMCQKALDCCTLQSGAGGWWWLWGSEVWRVDIWAE